MGWKNKKTLQKIKLQILLALAVSLTCPFTFAENDFFSPVSVDEVIASGSMHLDTSQIDNPILNGVFPSPSEYKAKNVKTNTGSSDTVSSTNNQTETGVFKPINKQKSVLECSYQAEGGEIKEIKPDDAPTFDNIGNFSPPSEYKPKVKLSSQKRKEETPVQQETFKAREASIDTYTAQAEEEYDFTEMAGKPVGTINIKGLRLLNEKIVLDAINIRKGSIFNEERLQNDLQRIYNTGYFTDSMQVEPVLEKNKTITLEFVLEENPEVKKVEIIGNTVFPQSELAQYTKNMENMPQNMILINDAIELINKHYEQNGYILAKVTNVDDTPDGTLKLEVTEGVIEKIVFEGEHKTKDYVIERNIMTQPGSVYNEELFKKDLARIYATQIFEKVDRTLTPSTEKEGEYVVSVSIKEKSSNGVSIGGGLDSGIGVFGSLSLWEKNLFGRGQQINLTGMIGSGIIMSDASIKNKMNYNVELSFKEPSFINADNSLLSRLYLREYGSYNIPIAIERRYGFNTTLSHKIRKSEKLSANLGFGFESIQLQEGDYIRTKHIYDLAGVNINQRAKQLTGGEFLNFAPGIRYSSVDSEFMPRDGLIAQTSFIEALSVGNIKHTNGRFAGSITKYIPILKKSSLSVGAKGGIKVHGDSTPEIMAFRLGGPYSIRGFRMNGVGSGNSFLMGSIELQTPLPFMDRFKYEVLQNLRVAFFVDGGTIWEPTITSKLYDRPNKAITAGVGLRINIPGLGPMAIDYGLPLTHVGRYNKQHGYVTFGTGGLFDSY